MIPDDDDDDDGSRDLSSYLRHTLENTRMCERRRRERTEGVKRINGSNCPFNYEKVRWR